MSWHVDVTAMLSCPQQGILVAARRAEQALAVKLIWQNPVERLTMLNLYLPGPLDISLAVPVPAIDDTPAEHVFEPAQTRFWSHKRAAACHACICASCGTLPAAKQLLSLLRPHQAL